MSSKSKRIINVTVQAPKEIPDEARAIAQAKAHEAAVLALWEVGEISASRAAQELDLEAIAACQVHNLREAGKAGLPHR